jgi:hypothetical protein
LDEDVTPRYFWRRLFAWVIDGLIAALISTILLWPFLGDRSIIRLDQEYLYFTNCHQITEMGDDLRALYPDYRLIGGAICDHYTFFVFNGQSLNLTAEQDGSDTRINISRPITFSGENSEFVAPIEPQSPVTLAIFIFGSALFLTFATGTPGKRLLGLYVEPDAAFPRLLKRECLRNLPYILYAISNFPNFFFYETTSPATVSLISYAQLATQIAALIVAVFLWLIPLIRWRGTMPYDRATGLVVTLS